MKKHLIFIILVFTFPTEGISQKIDSSFKDYTYLFVSAKIGTEYIKGSCFFIKFHREMFLITAAHVNKPWNPVLRKMYYDIPDTFYIKVFNKRLNKEEWLFFDNRAAKTDTSKYSIYENPDLFISKIKISKDFDIKTISKFLDFKDRDLSLKMTYGFNFGYSNSEPLTYEEMLSDTPNLSIGRILKGNGNENNSKNQSEFQKYNYVINLDSGSIANLKGMSGSPVFIFNSDSKIKFGGVIFGGVGNSIFVIKPKLVYEKLKTLSKQ